MPIWTSTFSGYGPAGVSVDEIIFSRRADADIIDILNYIANRYGALDSVPLMLERAFLALREMPLMGRDRGDIRRGLRSFPVDRTITIYYTIDSKALIVQRIVYRGRDFNAP